MTTDSRVWRVVSVTFKGGPLDGKTKRVPTDNPHMAPTLFTASPTDRYVRIGMTKTMQWQSNEGESIRPRRP